MHLIVLRTLLFCLLVPTAVALAQDNPLTTHNKHVYGGVQMILLRAAEKMPEVNYDFRPTDAVRSFGQIVGHVADSQYAFCSAALGAKNPAPKIENSKTSKADLIAALKDAFAHCDKAYDGLTDASGTQMVKFMGGDSPKLGVLSVNQIHTIEHYGNLVTYLRMKNIVPPTSEPAFMQQLQKK
ncbi:MAG: DinB family protein [Acidobacteriota bacterium]